MSECVCACVNLISWFSAVPIEVGYEITLYTVTESGGPVQLCAVLFVPGSGVAPRPFQLRVSTEAGTACN